MTEITQADRDAADKHGLWLLDDEREELAEAFARHRMEERAAIVAWLHEQWVTDATDNIDVFDMIDGIKAGEHLK